MTNASATTRTVTTRRPCGLAGDGPIELGQQRQRQVRGPWPSATNITSGTPASG